jgi:lipoyl(octanoyl) transferase
MQREKWRLIITSPNSGGWNMAVDEAILETVAQQAQPPTLRLYSWTPYCLSLGHAQPIKDVNLNTLSNNGWELVRRPTGGRAILHADELTYSVCAPLNNSRIQGGVIESYRMISNALLTTLEMIGIQADSKPKDQDQKHLSKVPVCFQFPSDYEITFSGKKIIGSAQARRYSALLQHGSVPLFGDISRIISCLLFETVAEKDHAKLNLLSKAATIKDIAGKQIPWKEVANTMIDAFEERFLIDLTHCPVSDKELVRAKELAAEKYNHPDWTYRV